MEKRLHITKTFFTIALLSLLFTACSGSKRMYKKGEKLDEAGMYTEAAEYYRLALVRKNTNEKASIALKTAGQKVLDDLLANFFTAHSANDYKAAVYAYDKATTYKHQIDLVGVKLTMPAYYKDYYESDKLKYINIVYQEANEHLEKEQFREAENDFNEILKFDPNNTDVKDLRKFAIAEPLYRKGKEQLSTANYRDAYYTFNDVLKGGNYKDSEKLKQVALEKATYTIAILPFENKTRANGAEAAISAKILQEISQSNNPFLRIIDRENLQTILDEQLLALSGNVDEESAIAAGELFGANAVLTGTVITASYNTGRLNYDNKTGYTSRQVKVKDVANPGKFITQTVYDKVTYKEYRQRNEVNISFSYKLISSETGEILISDVVEMTDVDEINYASFDGDNRNLFPGYWVSKTRNSAEDKVYNSYNDKRALESKLQGRRNITSVENIASNLYSKIADRAASKIIAYNPEK